MKLEIEPGFTVDYYEHFYANEEGFALLTALLAIPMTHPRFMGREARRMTAQFGERYNYSAHLRRGAEPEEFYERWPAVLGACKDRIGDVVGP